MKLNELLTGVRFIAINCSLDTDVSGLTMNSKSVEKDFAFFAVRGGESDGNNYIHDALAMGASVVFSEYPQKSTVPCVVVEDIRDSIGRVAANFYKHSERELKIITVVGTNGKTTTCHVLAEILKNAGKKVAVIGTLGAEIDGKTIDTGFTTPDPLILHELFAKAVSAQVQYVIMEASAHAIYFKKLAGIVADVAVFTNFSQDHLDFFKTMEEYKAVKIGYFKPENMRFAVVNIDDPIGRQIAAQELPFSTTYGIFNPADTFAMDITYKAGKTNCLINAMDTIFDIKTSLVGEFNIYNILGAVAVGILLGIEPSVIHNAVSKMNPVEGRFNLMAGKNKNVIIDFAHTPDGLKNLLQAARKTTDGKIILVFGCGGNRDASKRPIMGEIAGELADFVILTEDNSRDESTRDIIAQIEQGLRRVNTNYVKIEDRANAVTYGVLAATEKDLVIIAGKGGENYIESGGIKRPYSDKKVVEDIFGRYDL